MSGKRAKILSTTDVHQLLLFASRTRNPLRNRVIVLLSAKAGLRAGEIAALTWDMLADAQGRVGRVIELRDCAAKKGSGRLIPVHPELRDALMAWQIASANSTYFVRSERGGQMTPLSVVVWFNRAFQKIGLKGCSSHLVGGRSSRAPRGLCIVRVGACGTYRFSQVTGHSKPRRDTSTAIPMPNADLSH